MDNYEIRIVKKGPAEDFFVVLHPRTGTEGPARVEPTKRGEGVRIVHEEGTD